MTIDWRHRAACRDEDPEIFFPVGSSGPALAQIQEAKSVCRRCPVSGECLNWALATGQSDGVWGGLTEEERRAHQWDRGRRSGKRIASPEPQPMKVCEGCRTDQTLDQFQKDSKRQDNTSRLCKGCISVRDRKRRAREDRIAS